MEHRKSLGLQTISIVGYTNSGKTSLFNLLTHKKHLVENTLFATLDSTVGEVYMLQLNKQVVVSVAFHEFRVGFSQAPGADAAPLAGQFHAHAENSRAHVMHAGKLDL